MGRSSLSRLEPGNSGQTQAREPVSGVFLGQGWPRQRKHARSQISAWSEASSRKRAIDRSAENSAGQAGFDPRPGASFRGTSKPRDGSGTEGGRRRWARNAVFTVHRLITPTNRRFTAEPDVNAAPSRPAPGRSPQTLSKGTGQGLPAALAAAKATVGVATRSGRRRVFMSGARRSGACGRRSRAGSPRANG